MEPAARGGRRTRTLGPLSLTPGAEGVVSCLFSLPLAGLAAGDYDLALRVQDGIEALEDVETITLASARTGAHSPAPRATAPGGDPHSPVPGYSLRSGDAQSGRAALRSGLAAAVEPGGTLEARIQVESTGNRSGAEVVQLYLHDVASSLDRPHEELKGFSRVELQPGQSETLTFTVDEDRDVVLRSGRLRLGR